ncbi:hypothetical protein [Paenibacillus sp. L3-i20]|uniref:hypothetical protein n=1 Tax=Paenibacillus sp. L3-i20 TaxID=2905833 RepID=UPI00208389DC|nr:hypothetical protein L3i20_v209470 [Paenibacillus sp. L3-i20]
MHEEIVIERRAIDHEASDDPIHAEEIIRISLSLFCKSSLGSFDTVFQKYGYGYIRTNLASK